MATYAVYLPPNGPVSASIEGFRLVRDGKTPWALIAPPIWLAWHRLWWPLLAYALAIWAIALLAYWQPGTAVLYLSGLPGLYLLLEGSELVRGRYEKLGWHYAGVVEGETPEEAELRFAAAFEDGIQIMPNYASDTSHKVPFKSVSAAGLFPE